MRIKKALWRTKELKHPEEDSNLCKGNQNPLCYHYTIGVRSIKHERLI